MADGLEVGDIVDYKSHPYPPLGVIIKKQKDGNLVVRWLGSSTQRTKDFSYTVGEELINTGKKIKNNLIFLVTPDWSEDNR